MHELSLQNIDQITNDIRKQDIAFSHLLDDLIDHVCCDVEYEMQSGLNYSEAYRKVKQKMGSRRLIEIQEETLYAVDTNYRKMKKTMKISGIAGTILFGFAALFKIMHWPLAGIMMTLGAIILAFIFMPSALGVLWKETHSRKRLFLFISSFFAGMLFILGTLFKIQHWPAADLILSLSALIGVFFFIPALLVNRFSDQEMKFKRPVYVLGAAGIIFYVLGMLFKIQHWPLATVFMMIGVVTLCMLAFPWYIWLRWKEASHISAEFIFFIVISLVIVVPGALINLNLQRDYQTGFYVNMDQEQVLYKSLYSNIQSRLNLYQDSSGYPEIQQLHARTTTLLQNIGTLQVKMIEEAEGKPGVPAVNPVQIKLTESGPEIQYNLLSNPFDIGSVRNYLLPGCTSREKLETELDDYIDYIAGLRSHEDLQKYTGFLQPSVSFSLEMVESGVTSLMSALHYLELLKNSLLSLESFMISEIVKH